MKKLRYLSLFSGIEAATMAWHSLGWESVAFSEIEPFPCAVLAHHYPEIPNLGDVTKITEDQIKKLGPIDLVVFGSPCQDLSVAGARKGFTDAEGNETRSGLFMDAIRIIRWARQHNGCRFALWENVPGAFSSNKGRDFAQVVGHMAGLGDVIPPPNGWGNEGAAVGDDGMLEWAVLDAQWFGLAQRRKRVFALVDFGDWAGRPPILLERHSLRGDTPPSRETGKEVAGTLASRTNGGGFPGSDECMSGYVQPVVTYALQHAQIGRKDSAGPQGKGWQEEVAFTQDSRSCADAGAMCKWPAEVASTLNASFGSKLGLENQHIDSGAPLFVPVYGIPVNWIGRSPENGGNAVEPMVNVAPCLTKTDRHAVCMTGDITHTLKAEGFDGSEDGTGRGTPIIAFSCKDNGADAGSISPTLLSMNSVNSNQNSGGQVAIAFPERLSGTQCASTENLSPSLCAKNPTAVSFRACGQNGFTPDVITPPIISSTGGGSGVPTTQYGMVVRRLTPREYERLQGFPNDFTLIPVRGKPAADGPRYKALGNSMAVNVMRYIGEKVMAAL